MPSFNFLRVNANFAFGSRRQRTFALERDVSFGVKPALDLQFCAMRGKPNSFDWRIGSGKCVLIQHVGKRLDCNRYLRGMNSDPERIRVVKDGYAALLGRNKFSFQVEDVYRDGIGEM